MEPLIYAHLSEVSGHAGVGGLRLIGEARVRWAGCDGWPTSGSPTGMKR